MDVPESQVEECEVDPEVDEDDVFEDEQEMEPYEAADRYYASKRPYTAGKRPRTEWAKPSVAAGEGPTIFAGIDPELQKSVCRAWNSYLTALKKCQDAKAAL